MHVSKKIRRILLTVLASFGLVVVAGVSPANAAYPTSSSVCGSSTFVFGTPCVRIVETTPSRVFAYAAFYEADNRPKVSRVTVTVEICGYGTSGSCRDLGAGYTRTYDITSTFGRGCPYNIGGGWNFAPAGCQVTGDNWNLTAGNLYRADANYTFTEYPSGAVYKRYVTSGWIQAQG